MTEDTAKQTYPKKTATAVPAIIKMVTLANAGGVAATMTVIGATANKNGCLESILALPLLLFSLGVISAIGFATSIYLQIAKHEGYEPNPPKCLISDCFTHSSGYASVAMFILGCLAGVIIVFVA